MSSICMLFVQGSHYDIGYQIGVAFKSSLQLAFNANDFLVQIENYASTEEGKAFCGGYLDICHQRFPHYIDELRGLAEGAEINLDKVLLYNLDREIMTKLGLFKEILNLTPRGCTDILCTNENEILIGHNEDWAADMKGKDFLVCAHIDQYQAKDGRVFPAEHFVAHVFPGYLFGMNSWFNHHGLAVSIDHLYPQHANSAKTPELFLCRQVVAARDVQEAIEFITDEGRGVSVGCCFNIGHVGSTSLWNIEQGSNPTEPRSKLGVTRVDPEQASSSSSDTTYGACAHFNNFETIKDIPVFTVPHCLKRMAVYQELAPPTSKQHVCRILGDTKVQKENPMDAPIYQAKTDDLPWCTVATVLLDIKRECMTVYQDNPYSSLPVAVLPFAILKS